MEKRIAILEAANSILEVWVTLFVAIAALLLAANIGLSVWQVGSIARREIDSLIREYDEKFQGVLSSGAKIIDERFSSYESQLKSVNDRLSDLQPNLQKDLDVTHKILAEVKVNTNDLLNKFKADSEDIKKGVLSEIENTYLKQLQDFLSKKHASSPGNTGA